MQFEISNNEDDDEASQLNEQLLDTIGLGKMVQMGHKLQTMLLGCDFQGHGCSPK